MTNENERRQTTAPARMKDGRARLCGQFLELARRNLWSAIQEAKVAGDAITASRAQTALEELYRAQDSNESFQRGAADELAAAQEGQPA